MSLWPVSPPAAIGPRNAPRLNTKAWYIASTASRDRFAAFGACWKRAPIVPDILAQAAAANAALNAFSRELLAQHLRTCVVQDIRQGKDETIDELMDTLRKLMR